MDDTGSITPRVTPIFPKKVPDRLSWPAPSSLAQGGHSNVFHD